MNTYTRLHTVMQVYHYDNCDNDGNNLDDTPGTADEGDKNDDDGDHDHFGQASDKLPRKLFLLILFFFSFFQPSDEAADDDDYSDNKPHCITSLYT